MTGKTVLHPGDPFPALTVDLPGGRTLHLPDDLAGRFGVVLFYRGSWCPYCNAQLSAFQRALDGLAEVDASIVALSVDDEATTRDLIARHAAASGTRASGGSAGSHHPVPRPGHRPGLARPGSPHLNDDARHRQNPVQQTGGAPWHRNRMTRT